MELFVKSSKVDVWLGSECISKTSGERLKFNTKFNNFCLIFYLYAHCEKIKNFTLIVFPGSYRNATLVAIGLKRNIYLLLKQGGAGGANFTAICRFIILKYFLYILAGAGLIAGIVIIIILALIIIGLLMYWLFWRRRQNRDSDTEFHTKNSKKRPISPKELGMCIHREIFSKIYFGNLIISCHSSLSISPENVRKPEVFWCFQWV